MMSRRISYQVLVSAMAYISASRQNGTAVRATNKSYDKAVQATEAYNSRGHGGRKQAHKPTGIAKARRAARKAKNRG